MPANPNKPIPRKRRTAKPRKKNGVSDFQKSIYIVLGVFFALLVLALGYILGGGNDDDVVEQSYKTAQEYSIGELLNDLTVIKANEETKKPKLVKKKETAIPAPKKEVPEKPVEKKPLNTKPKLSIIMDDISKQAQLDKLQALGMSITPSIFPPSELSMKSHNLAKGLEHFMVHLPMESGNAKLNKHYKTQDA